MNLAIAGACSPELLHRLTEAAASVGLEVHVLDDADAWAEFREEGSNWDALALGGGLSELDRPAAVAELLAENPTGLLIVLGEPGDRELRRAALDAGAFDVIYANASKARVELSMRRAAEWLGRLGKHVEAEKIQAISQLAIGVNHEINNPLTGLMGTAELIMLENKELPEKLRRDITTILTQARRIMEITARLRHLNHLRTIPYDDRDAMIDLLGADRPSAAKPAPAPTPEPEPIFQTPSLFIVDDNQLVIDVVERLLDGRYAVTGANEPAEAVERLRERAFDLVLLDLTLPDDDPIEVMRRLKKSRPGQRVMVTGVEADDPRIARAMAEGAADWVKKPFDFDALERALGKALKDRSPKRDSGA